ncbi:MAG: ATP-binding protein [Acidimicrobiia bacterium]
MRVRVCLLGGLSVSVDGSIVEASAWRSRRATQLVALLALAPRRRLATEHVMDVLWPELSPEAARANLHKTATLARQALGSKESVVLRGEAVALWPAAEVDVDVMALEAAAQAALASDDPAACAAVARELRAEVLPEERYEDWASGPRARMRRLRLELLRAAGAWAQLAEAEPTDEVAHRELMKEHAEAGRLHAAIRQFQRLRTILGRELGVLPGPETVRLYREVLGAAASGWVKPALVGREVELVRARAALRRASEGRPAALFVTGPAGIGKTRMGEELVEHVAGDGWMVMRGSGREQTSSVPYWPLVEALQAALFERPELAGALGEGEQALLARLTGLASDQPGPPVHRHAVLHLLGRVVSSAGGAGSMLFLDDLQWVDDDTLALAEVLADAATPRGMLVLATLRPDEDERSRSVVRHMVGRGVGVEIALNPLSRTESDAIVADVLDRDPSHSELELAWELSGGNPFFALEVAAALSSDEAAADAGAYGAVDVRLERLAAPTRGSLCRVALIAHQFTADEYAALAGVDGDRALDDLEQAMAGGVVARQGSSYRFRHDLVRERLTVGVAADDRRTAHGGAADRLAALGAPPARVVHHLLAAGRSQDALPWLRRAASEALGLGAHADALGAVERGLALSPRDPSFLALRAEAMDGLGDPGAPAAYSVAITLSPEPERAALLVKRAKALIVAGDVPSAVETLEAVRWVPPALRGQLLVARGLACWCSGALDDAEAAGREARQRAEETGSVRDFVDATMVLAMVAHERGAWPQRVVLDLLDTQVRPDLAAVVMDAHLCVAESYLYGGVPYPDVLSFASDLRDRAAASGALRAEAFATTMLGEAHLLMGRTDEAVRHLRSAADQHSRVGLLCGQALSLQRLAQASVAEGDAAGARAALAAALSAARGSPVGIRHLLDRVYGTAIQSAPSAAEALAAVDEASRGIRGPIETCPPCSINLTVPAAIACAQAGDLQGAGAYLARAEGVAAAFYPQGGWPAALEEVRGHLALAGGDTEAGVGRLGAAAESFERLGQRLDAARCRRTIEGVPARSRSSRPHAAGKV